MPGRPAKQWMRRCVAGVASKGRAVDPGAVCGAVWKRKSEYEKKKLIRAEARENSAECCSECRENPLMDFDTRDQARHAAKAQGMPEASVYHKAGRWHVPKSNPISPGATALIIATGAAALATLAYLAFGKSDAATATAPALPKYDPNNAVAALDGSTITIPLGTSVHLESGTSGMWQTPGPTVDDARVLWPDPNALGHFVAVGSGTAVIKGVMLPSPGNVSATVNVK